MDIQNPHCSHPAGLSSWTLAGSSLDWSHVLLDTFSIRRSETLRRPHGPTPQSCFISPGLPKTKPSDFSQLKALKTVDLRGVTRPQFPWL